MASGFIAGVLTSKNEADIAGTALRHHLNEGVARIYIADGMSTDGTRDVIADVAREYPGQIKVYDDDSLYHRQPYWSSRLAHEAYEDGAGWILAQDFDEFWYATNGETIAERLEVFEDEGFGFDKLYATMYHHLDFDYRNPDSKPLPKVAFRARDGVRVANGNHDVSGLPGQSLNSVLAIRELQYRGFEHFCRKIVERNATLDPSLPPGEGTHHSQYAGWSKEQLEPVWQAMVDRATVLDPIPVRR